MMSLKLTRPGVVAARSAKNGSSIRQQSRWLSLHEYQSQDLLRQYNVPVPKGHLAESPKEVQNAMLRIGTACAIKAQVLKGGRGKGSFDSGLHGGVQIAETPAQGNDLARNMLGHRLRTKQTDSAGLQVRKVYVAEQILYEDEWYLALTIDRENYTAAVIASKSGGIDIEAASKEHPDSVITVPFSVSEGITSAHVHRLASTLGIPHEKSGKLNEVLQGLYKILVEKDATMLEINPLVRRKDGSILCLDAKFRFDSAAESRQADLFALRDSADDVSAETEALKHGLVYVRMEGNIGNVVNGAGLAMATNDAISLYGGSSANFLDVGGQATKETMQHAFRLILQDERVKVILVNIYGGITNCEMIAESVIGASQTLGSKHIPIVVRLQGTNAAEGLKLLEDANLGLYVEAGFGEAAEKATTLARASSS